MFAHTLFSVLACFHATSTPSLNFALSCFKFYSCPVRLPTRTAASVAALLVPCHLTLAYAPHSLERGRYPITFHHTYHTWPPLFFACVPHPHAPTNLTLPLPLFTVTFPPTTPRGALSLFDLSIYTPSFFIVAALSQPADTHCCHHPRAPRPHTLILFSTNTFSRHPTSQPSFRLRSAFRYYFIFWPYFSPSSPRVDTSP